MKFILIKMKLIFVVALVVFSAIGYCQNVVIELPKAKPTITYKDKYGRSKLPPADRYEFSKMNILMKMDPSSKTGFHIPVTKCEALGYFKAALPSQYFNRLLKGYSLSSEELELIGDAPVDERLYDVQMFFYNAWGLKDKNGFYNANSNKSLELIWFLIKLELQHTCKPDSLID